MSYKIYELVKPEILKKTEPDGYHIKTTELITIKEADCYGLDWSYNSELEARKELLEIASGYTGRIIDTTAAGHCPETVIVTGRTNIKLQAHNIGAVNEAVTTSNISCVLEQRTLTTLVHHIVKSSVVSQSYLTVSVDITTIEASPGID